MKKLRAIIALALLFGFSGTALAEQISSESKNEQAVDLGEVISTASRYEELVESVPANVTVIKAEDIRKSTARNIPDLLRSQVGVFVNDITGNGRSFSVDIRGFGAAMTAQTNTLVLIDGRRVNQPDLSGTDWSLISLDRIERIEVIRGGRGSVLYGDNATGGVINIITKSGKGLEGFQAKADVMAGSYDTFDASASASGSTQKASYALSARYSDSEGYRDNSETEFKDIGGNAAWYAADWLEINFSGDYHKDNAGLPGSILRSDFAKGVSRTDSLTPDNFADVEDYYFKAGPQAYFWNNSVFRADASYRKRSSVFDISFTGGNFVGDTDIETNAFAPQVVFKEKIFGKENSLTIGFDYEKATEDILNTSVFFGTASVGDFELEKESTGYYIQDEFKPVEAVALSAGARYDRARFEFDPGRPDHVTMDETAYNAGASCNFHKKSYVYFGYSKSFRYPVLDEFFNFSTNTVNTNLDAQTSDDYEVGARHYFSETFFADVNFFLLDTENEIFYNTVTFANENLDGDTRRQGVELTLAKEFERMKLKATYSYTDAEIRGGQYSGEHIPNVPEHKASFDSEFELGAGFLLALTGIYVGERPFDSDFANQFDDQDDYFLLNAKILYKWKNFTPFVNLNNITNEEYSEYGVLGGFPTEEAFYPSPKFNFMVGITAEM